MEPINVPEKLTKRLGDNVKVIKRSEKRYVAEVAPENLVEACRYVFRDLGARMCTATGIDQRASVELMYHMSLDAHNQLISVRTFVPKPECIVDSVGAEIPAAVYIEREMAEMLGVTFENHPDPRRLELPEEWPEGTYPWRRGEL